MTYQKKLLWKIKKNLSKFYPQKNNLLSKLISLIFDYFHSIKISIHNFKLFLTSLIYDVKKISPQKEMIDIKSLDFNEHHRKELNDKGYIFFDKFF